MAVDMMMAARMAELEGLVRECGEQFRFYEASHRSKIRKDFRDANQAVINRDALHKAEVNRALAERCEKALGV